MGLAISLGATWAIEAKLELCLLCVLMKAKNRFQSVHHCLANLHTELVPLLFFFLVIANFNTEIKISRVYSQLHRKETTSEEQDLVAVT